MKTIAGMLLAVSGIAISTPAGAVTISGTMYEDTVSAQCSTTLDCIVQFPLSSAIAGKFLNVEDISCSGIIGKPFRAGMLFLTDGGLTNIRRKRGLTLAGPNLLGNFSWHEAVKFKISGGPPRVLNIEMFTSESTSTSGECTIVGTISAQ